MSRPCTLAQAFGASCGVLALARAHIDEASSQLNPRILGVVFLAAFFASVTSWDVLQFQRVIRLLSGSPFAAIGLSSVYTSVAAFVAHEIAGNSEAVIAKSKVSVSSNSSVGGRRGKQHGLSGATKEKDLSV